MSHPLGELEIFVDGSQVTTVILQQIDSGAIQVNGYLSQSIYAGMNVGYVRKIVGVRAYREAQIQYPGQHIQVKVPGLSDGMNELFNKGVQLFYRQQNHKSHSTIVDGSEKLSGSV